MTEAKIPVSEFWECEEGFKWRMHPNPGNNPFQVWLSGRWETRYGPGCLPHTPCEDPSKSTKPEWRRSEEAHAWAMRNPGRVLEFKETPCRFMRVTLSISGDRFTHEAYADITLGACDSFWRPSAYWPSGPARPVEGGWNDETP